MHAISVKELRTKFPFVRSELAKGTTFLIIHKSKPIGELKPISENGSCNYDQDETVKDFERASANDWLKLYPPITKEEHDYYMSLPPYKD